MTIFYINEKINDSEMQAAEMLANYRKIAVEELGTKEEQISTLQKKLIEMGEAFEVYRADAENKIKEVQDNCNQKLQEQKDKIDENTKTVQESYNQAFIDQQANVSIREYSPICQDKIVEIRECYSNNKGTSLKCSKIVAELQKCVDEAKKERF